jgi:hypothetical protein
MAVTTEFFVLAFSRDDKGAHRTEVAMKALSERHGASLAAHFEGARQGAVAFSRTGDPSSGLIEILARFGDVPDDRALRQSGNDWGLGSTEMWNASSPGRRHKHTGRSGLAFLWAIAAALIGGSSLVVIAARGALREHRLVEMVRPACDHTGTTNRELHRLVHLEVQAGASKTEVVRNVLAQCQAKPRTS